jgi:apolipoprotein N-acyltransferase
VPFGEIIPFKQNMPWLHEILMAFNPYDYDYSLDFGQKYTIFEISKPENDPDKLYRFAVMICYESTAADIAANFVLDENAHKQIDWLVNISNDGWFVKFDQDSIKPSTELSQHAAVSVFRAVENRVSIIRSVNTGISCLIDSTGRFMNDYQAGNLPENVMDRGGMSGWFADKMPIDNRVTFFSKHANWLGKVCLYCSAGLIIWIIGERIIKLMLTMTGKISRKKK